MSDATPTPTAPAPRLSSEDKQTLLTLARETLTAYLGDGRLPPCHTTSGALLAPGAVFVTLHRRDTEELRGCRGEILPRTSLVEAVQRMTIASALDDPRFPAVSFAEIPLLHIEISALSPLVPIRPEDVVVGRHGLMIRKGRHAGLLLPQVPVEHGWDRNEFLRWVCHKAGLPDDAWTARDAELQSFECEVWGEPE